MVTLQPTADAPGGSGELDEITLARAQKGERVAWAALVAHHQGAVFALISRILGRRRGSVAHQDLAPTVCHFGELFLPPALILYFAPAIAEHGRDIAVSGELEVEYLVAALAKTLPAGAPHIDPGSLARTITSRSPAREIHSQGSYGCWSKFSGRSGFAKAVVLLAEVDAGGSHTEALFSTDRHNVAMTIIEHDQAVLETSWRPERSSARRFYDLDALVARLERFAESRYEHVARAARDVLGAT